MKPKYRYTITTSRNAQSTTYAVLSSYRFSFTTRNMFTIKKETMKIKLEKAGLRVTSNKFGLHVTKHIRKKS